MAISKAQAAENSSSRDKAPVTISGRNEDKSSSSDKNNDHDKDDENNREKARVDCRAPDAPYRKYDCLDSYLGEGFLERLINYYRLEWGQAGPPRDPNAPPSRIEGWPSAWTHSKDSQEQWDIRY